MGAETTTPADAEFCQRMAREGDLGEILCHHLWDRQGGGTFSLGGETFEMAYPEEVPGYEDEDAVVLLRRKADGQVFEAEIDVTLRPVRAAEQPASLSDDPAVTP